MFCLCGPGGDAGSGGVNQRGNAAGLGLKLTFEIILFRPLTRSGGLSFFLVVHSFFWQYGFYLAVMQWFLIGSDGSVSQYQ